MGKNSSAGRVVVNSVIYTFSGLLLKCFSFFLLPLYTAYLTTKDYGITSIANSFISTMSFVVTFSLFSAVMRFYVDLKDSPEKLKRFYGTISLFSFLSGCVFFILFTLFRRQLSAYVFSGIDYYPVILVCLFSLIFSCQHTIFDNILRSQQLALKSSILSICFFLVTLILNLIFVVSFKMGALGSLLSMLLAYTIYTVYFVVFMIKKRLIYYCLDLELLKEALKYSVPIMPHNLSTQIALLISRVLISGTTSLESLGIYSVASQFGNIADTIQGYVDQAYGPWLYEKLHEKENGFKKSIRETARMLCAVIGLFFIGIALYSQDYILLFVHSAYVDAWKYVSFIVLVFAVKTMYYFYVEILFYYKKASKYLFTATLTSSLINVILSYILICSMGVYGSILADGLSMFIRVLIIVVISRRYDDIGLCVRDFLINFFIIAVFMGVGLILSVYKYRDKFSLLNFGYKSVVILLYLVLIIVMNKNQIGIAFEMFKNKFRRKSNK
jgi:O-antigen/teichoic acid export membrane protein